MERVKFKNLTGQDESNYLSNNKDALKVEELALILGGDGCYSGICNDKRDVGAKKYCDGSAVCTSGIGTCNNSTEMVVPYEPEPSILDKINLDKSVSSTLLPGIPQYAKI